MSADNTGVQALTAIIDRLEQIDAEYNAILAEVRKHEEQMAKEHAALARLHTRLKPVREAIRALTTEVWRVPWENNVPRQARAKTTSLIHALREAIDDLAWRLFEFKDKV